MLEAVDLNRRSVSGEVLLNGADLRIAPGERWGLFGPTGSGKTLFLRALALLDPTDSGEIRWQEQPIGDADVPAYRRQVIYLHQRPALIPGSVEENLRLPWSFSSAQNGAFDFERARRYLDEVGRSEGLFGRQSSQLSGGERQIVALVRAMLLEPKILLLDEPTAALDAASSRQVERLVQTYLEEAPEKRATVWVTHDADQLRRVADWRLTMDQGQTREPERVG